MENIPIDKGFKRVHFGQEIEALIGACYEKPSGDEMFFSLDGGFLASDHEGLGAAMVVFMELMMRRQCESSRNLTNLVLTNLKVDQISTPTSNLICGCSGVVHQSGNKLFMKAQLHCGENLIMSGTAVWSFIS